MASSVSSDLKIALRFLHQDGAELDSPREWQPATLLLPGVDPAHWTEVGVDVQGRALPVRLERMAGKVCITALWNRTGAGQWQVRVRVGAISTEYMIRVRSAKLSDTALTALVSDLEESLPASVAIGLDHLGAFAGLNWVPPTAATLAQELEQVRRALDGADGGQGLIAVLHEIARQPHWVLASGEHWVRAEAARRPMPNRLAAAFARPGNLLRADMPAFVADAQMEASFDTYENRLLREFHDQVDRRLRVLERATARLPSFAVAHGALLADLRKRLRSARYAAAFLDGIGVLRIAPDRLTEALLRRSEYRAALEGYLRFRRSARVRLSHPVMDAPMEDVPALYELWGVLLVLTELLSAAAQAGWRVTKQQLLSPGAVDPLLRVLVGGAALVLQRGPASAALYVQRSFRPADIGLRSLSFEQRPDLVLDVHGTSGGRALHLFDPKYKLVMDETEGGGAPTKLDIDKMHAYRDAIRDAEGNRVVRSAAILYPGPDRTFGDGIAAMHAQPGASPGLLREWLTAVLRPEHGLTCIEVEAR